MGEIFLAIEPLKVILTRRDMRENYEASNSSLITFAPSITFNCRIPRSEYRYINVLA